MKISGTLLSVLSLFSMSLAPLLNKYALVSLNWCWGAALSSLFCFLIAAVAKPSEFRELVRSRFDVSKPLVFIALTNSLGLLCQYGAVAQLEPATLSILGRMYVVFAIVLAQVFLRERCARAEYIVLTCVLTGAGLFCWTANFRGNALGITLCLAYCFFFALTHLQIKIETSRSSANKILLTNNLVTAVVLIPVAFACAGSLHDASFQTISLIAGAAFFGQWLGLLLFYESLKRIPMVKANLIRSFSPIVGVAVTYPFFPVILSRIQVIGASVMIFALVTQAVFRRVSA